MPLEEWLSFLSRILLRASSKEENESTSDISRHRSRPTPHFFFTTEFMSGARIGSLIPLCSAVFRDVC
jgi:hypothetical protein